MGSFKHSITKSSWKKGAGQGGRGKRQNSKALEAAAYQVNCTEEVEASMYKLIDCMDGPRSRVYAVNTYNVSVERKVHGGRNNAEAKRVCRSEIEIDFIISFGRFQEESLDINELHDSTEISIMP